jgi:hypothetical protein
MPYPIRSPNDLDSVFEEVIRLSEQLSAAHLVAGQLSDGNEKRKIIESLYEALESGERIFRRIVEVKAKQSSRF